MKATVIVRVLIVSAVIVASGRSGWHLGPGTSGLAHPLASITITQPDGMDDVVGEGDDFATAVLGDPWDMSQSSDLLALHGLPGATISGGLLRFTMQGSATEVQIYLSGLVGAMDVGKIGANYPIDADHYRWLSFRMYQPMGSVEIKWFYDRFFTASRKFASSQLFPVTPGWHTYVIDLKTLPIGNTGGGATGWNGKVWELNIVPFASPGTEIVIDWIRLTADNPVDNSLSITWSDLSPSGSEVHFQLDDDRVGCDGPPIYVQAKANVSGSFAWHEASRDVASPANVEPGTYYVCARVNGELAGYSDGTLRIDRAPIIDFTQPSFTSGDDYATDAGNPWDMGDAADVKSVNNGGFALQNGVLAVTVPSTQDDVQVYLNVPTGIDSNRYYYLTYRLWFDYPYTWTDVGQVTRIFWGRGLDTEATSGLIYVFPGWHTYSVDLRSVELASGLPWSSDNWDLFRIDPIANHTHQTVIFYVDDVRLTGDEQADRYADITWTLTDPDSSLTTMDLYYDSDRGGEDGTLITALTLSNGQRSAPTVSPTAGIGSSLIVTDELTKTMYLPLMIRNWHTPCSGACYTWDTSGIEPGTYYLYACVNDGQNELCRYSEKPLLIRHP